MEGNLYIGEKLCLKSKNQRIDVGIYQGNPTFLKDAIESVQNQTLRPSELVLVEDGPLTPELYQVLDQVEAESNIPVKHCPLEQNQGWVWLFDTVFYSASMILLPVWIRMT